MSDAAPILQVVFDTPLRRSFDYLAPAGLPPPRPGVRVRVPFGRQRAVGVVVAHATSSALARAQLKPVFETLDPAPLWDDPTFGLLRWAAEYYHHPLGDVLFGALPKMLREGRSAVLQETVWRLSQAGRAALAGGARFGPRRRWLAAGVAAALAGLLALPVPHRIAAPAQLEGRLERRGHARPADAGADPD